MVDKAIVRRVKEAYRTKSAMQEAVILMVKLLETVLETVETLYIYVPKDGGSAVKVTRTAICNIHSLW